MPRVPKDQVQPHELYGMQKVDSSLTMGMRIRKRFRPSDTVKVRNITNTMVEWQWLDEQDESYVIEDDTNIKITDRDDPGLWRLGPGETDILIGACAYLMIEALYKQVCVMKTGIVINPLSEREIRNFSIDDPERQELFIDAVFLGKLSPQDMQAAALGAMAADTKPQILEELPPLVTEQEERERRETGQRAMRQPAKPQRELSDLADEFDPGSTLLGTATGGLPSDRGSLNDEPAKPAAKDKPATPKANKDKEPVTA